MSAAERLSEFKYPPTLEGVGRAMRDFDEAFGHLIAAAPAPLKRDELVRVKATGREAQVMLVRPNGDVTVRYEDKTCETLWQGSLQRG